jgi:ribosome maturation factor RimP
VDSKDSALFFYSRVNLDLVSNRSGVEQRFYDLSLKIAGELSLEVYDLEWVAGSSELRLFIMDPHSKTAVLDDCVRVDRAFSPYFESETWIPENVTLEVSSPGLFRSLKTLAHFHAVVGEDITLMLNKPITEEQSVEFPKSMRNNLKLKVKLLSTAEDKITVEIKDLKIDIPFGQIKKANLETNLNK